jgi:SpoVK/Ycf46/Vps4 family AAA+-type ATPase
MSGPIISDSPSLFTRTLEDCRELYLSSGRLCAHEYPQLISQQGDEFVQLMDDLHRALVLKVYVTVCQADQKWSEAERFLAEALFEHLWGKRLTGDTLRQTARKAAEDSARLKWYSLIRPFDRIVPLRQRIGELETVVMRLANLVARADGSLKDQEAAAIKSIQAELQHHLRQVPVDEPRQHEGPNAAAAEAIEKLQDGADDMYSATRGGASPAAKGATAAKKAKVEKLAPTVSLEEALAELDGLIGLDRVKHEVRTLTNYLKLQKRRGEAGLPDTDMSLHMVFTGNPGTGKTTVARILGKIFGAMGILAKGHLVETDRSGMVAEYMGQTGPKAQAKINEALDGVLFIDEAYSLVASEGQDVYGGEAIQALLKRAEDDRARLVVILAGYPDEMDAMLKSNPGLSSRFNRVLDFADYSPLDLARIFECLCKKNHYKLAHGTRPKLMLGLTEMHRRRDRHFGNGRAVRNLFEQAIRRMANRIADVRELSTDQLVSLETSDIEFEGSDVGADSSSDNGEECRFNVTCPKCSHTSKSRGEYLGKKVTCPKCKAEFMAEWGVPVESGAPQS